MQCMGVPVFHAHRDDVQGNLNEEAGEHQRANEHGSVTMPRLLAPVLVVKLREQMQHRQAQQKRPREGVQEADMPGVVQPEAEDRRRPIYLAFILFNLVALPVLGVLGARVLPANLSGSHPAPYTGSGLIVSRSICGVSLGADFRRFFLVTGKFLNSGT